jgi:hypothetical protein
MAGTHPQPQREGGNMLTVTLLGLGLALTDPAAEPAPLAAFDFLVDHCWAADLPKGRGRDTHCFERMYGSHYLRDRHVVVRPDGGRYAGETIYAFDPAKKAIRFWYWASDGDFGEGTATAGKALAFEMLMGAGTPQATGVTATWTPLGATSYRSEQFYVKDGKSTQAWSIEYKVTQERPDGL